MDTDNLDDIVERLKERVSTYLAGDAAHRRKVMDNHLEVFEITDPTHPAKKQTEDVLRWIEGRSVERGLRAKKVSCPFP